MGYRRAASDDWLADLRVRLLADPRASVGEIGLDRWLLERAAPDDPRLVGVRRAPMEEQVATFLPQLALAAELVRPATIHCLHAYGDLLPLLRVYWLPKRGFLLHAYASPAGLIPEFAALGAFFSFNPAFLNSSRSSLTSPEMCNQSGYAMPEAILSQKLRAFLAVPAGRLFCEADAPAMLPLQVWRTHKLPPAPDGSPVNHPGNIEAACAGLAQLRGLDEPILDALIADNFRHLFGT